MRTYEPDEDSELRYYPVCRVCGQAIDGPVAYDSTAGIGPVCLDCARLTAGTGTTGEDAA